MKSLVTYLFVVVCINAVHSEINDEWIKFKSEYEKNYGSEETKKFKIFKENFEFIQKHKSEYGKSFSVDVNRFADLEKEDFEPAEDFEPSLWSYLKNAFTSKLILYQEIALDKDSEPPMEVDWRNLTQTAKVKNQKVGRGCDSNYAFATLDAVSVHYFIRNQTYLDLSAQEIIDCSELNFGCSGGTYPFTFNYLIENGIGLDKDYRYTAERSECKKENTPKSSATVFGYGGVSGEKNFTKALNFYGPLTVKVKASSKGFKFYKEGIFNDPDCDGAGGSHEVVLYGYGNDEETGLDYWIIKNSWTVNWGENGFMRVERGEKSCVSLKNGYFPLLDESDKVNNQTQHLFVYGLIGFGIMLILMMLCCCCIKCYCCSKKIETQENNDGLSTVEVEMHLNSEEKL